MRLGRRGHLHALSLCPVLCAFGASSLPLAPRRAPRIATMAAASASSSAAGSSGVLAGLAARADHSWMTQLRPDPDAAQHAPNKSSREVASGHYVPVQPTPLPAPRLLALSSAMAAELGLDPAACEQDEAFARFFAGDMDAAPGFQSWCTPYALSIMGQRYTNNCPFGNGNGYGDGRAVSIGEVVVPADARGPGAVPGSEARRWEMQLKGGGRTPFCRGADGRAVLRSSVREFLASEAMHNLGVPTTRALSLVVSEQETSQRPWYSERGADGQDISEDDPRLAQFPAFMRKQLLKQLQQGSQEPDVMVSEMCAITTRVSPSFLRVGHLDLFARRAFTERKTTDGPLLRELNAMLAHAIFRECPDLIDASAVADAAEAALVSKEVALEFLDRSASAIAHLMGEWLRVGFAQGNFNADNCLVGGRTMDYGPFGFMERYDPGFAKWTGSGDHFAFFNQPSAGFANWNVLAESVLPVVQAGGGSNKDLDSARTKAVAKFRAAVALTWQRKLGFDTPTGLDDVSGEHVSAELFKDVEKILRQADIDWTIVWRQLAAVVELSQPADGAADGAWSFADLSDAALMAPLEPAFAKPAEFADDKTGKLWAAWLRRWLAALQLEGDSPAVVAERMRLINPKFVPREWMLVECYTSAAAGDFGPLNELFALFSAPYDEHSSEMTEKYFCRSAAETRAGTAFMT